jgi:hypothetical protein
MEIYVQPTKKFVILTQDLVQTSSSALLEHIPKGSLFLWYKAIQPPTTKKKSLSNERKLFKPALKGFLNLLILFS